jgi:PncC family amidohydrolase
LVVHRLLAAQGATVAVAESLTGGLLGAALTATPGASATFRGGLVAYASDLKTVLLGVDPDLLAAGGAVHPAVALAMAHGARDRLAATYGLATTGVAGPEPADGQPAGTVHLGLAGPGGDRTVALHLPGDRSRVREVTVARALELLVGELTESRS